MNARFEFMSGSTGKYKMNKPPPPGIRQQCSAPLCGCGGFTLLEMLVTISVIAVLVALLFSGLQRSQNSALMAKDISQLRQIGIASITYANEHNGRFPTNMNFDPEVRSSTLGNGASGRPPHILWKDGYLPNLGIFYSPRQKIYTWPDDTTDWGKAGFAREGPSIGYMFYIWRTPRDDPGSVKDFTVPDDIANARLTDNPRAPIYSNLTHVPYSGVPAGGLLNILHLDGAVSQVQQDEFLAISSWMNRMRFAAGIDF